MKSPMREEWDHTLKRSNINNRDLPPLSFHLHTFRITMAVRDPCDEVDRALAKAMEGRGGLIKDRVLIRSIPPPIRLGFSPFKTMMTEAEFKAS